MGIRYPWAEGLNMGLDHSWGSGMSSRVATSQLKEPRGMTFLIPTSGVNPYSSLRPMGNVYPYSIVVVANVWKCQKVNGKKGGFFVKVIFLQVGSKTTISFALDKCVIFCKVVEMLINVNFCQR